MRRTIILFAMVVAVYSCGWGQSGILPPSNSIAVTDNAVSVLSNPAWLGIRPGTEAMLLFPYTDSTSSEDLGLLIKLGPLGFAGEFVQNDLEFYNRYTLGSGFNLGEDLFFGVSHSWYRVVDWQGSWNFGLGYRPLPFLSVGATAYDLNQPERADQKLNPTYGLAFAVRPFGHRLTLSGDFLFTKDESRNYGDEMDPRIRVEAMPLDGVRFMGEYQTDSKVFSV
ncbi:MAG: hypothetical protein ABH878_10155, partial [bacterium]